jgi:hypothetical protein
MGENQPREEHGRPMGDPNEDRSLQILENISSGQKQLSQLMTQLIVAQNHGNNSGAGGSNVNNGNNGEGRHHDIPTPNQERVPT